MIYTPEQGARLLCVHRVGTEGQSLTCISNSCGAWRWQNDYTGTLGYCGLAGPVVVPRLQSGEHLPYGFRSTLLAPNERTVPFPGASELHPTEQAGARRQAHKRFEQAITRSEPETTPAAEPEF